MALKGQSAHLKRLARLSGPRLRGAVFAALTQAGEQVRTEAALTIARGAVQGRGHVPARPGAPPSQDTGQLEASLATQGSSSQMTVEVSASAPYAADLEFGNSRLEERPFLRPAAEKLRPQILRKIARAVKDI